MIDNRAALLRCALTLFAERGYDAVGVQEICDAAGITKPTLYHYFGSKHGLLQAVLDAHQAPFLRSMALACAYSGDLPAALERTARVFFDFAIENPIYCRMQVALLYAPRGSEGFEAIAAYYEEQHRLVEELFTTAVKEYGNIRGRERLYAELWIGSLNTCTGLWLSGYAQLDDAMVRGVTRQFQYGIYS